MNGRSELWWDVLIGVWSLALIVAGLAYCIDGLLEGPVTSVPGVIFCALGVLLADRLYRG